MQQIARAVLDRLDACMHVLKICQSQDSIIDASGLLYWISLPV